MIAAVAAFVAVFAAALILGRVVAGPTLYDRLLAAASVSAKLALALAAASVATGRAALLDHALAQLLLGTALALAAAKAVRLWAFAPPLEPGAPSTPREPPT